MLIYVVRHGETEYNREEIFRGRKDIPLNDAGIEQARKTGLFFKDKGIRRIFTSPLLRAKKTAEVIGTTIHTPIEVLEDLTDMDFGIWEGVTLKEIMRLYPDDFSRWRDSPHRFRVKGGESLNRVRKRIKGAMEHICSFGDYSYIIVTHRVLCKIMILYALNVSNSHFWGIKFDPASISLIEQRDNGMFVHFVNDTCHLKDGITDSAYRDF
ncbi:MAG: histidine phosphatase family protein [Syntrophorhabdaceae bacterium]|nr:histidine phosphatase family protein [Syntrophorhabdaceae bacterium]